MRHTHIAQNYSHYTTLSLLYHLWNRRQLRDSFLRFGCLEISTPRCVADVVCQPTVPESRLRWKSRLHTLLVCVCTGNIKMRNGGRVWRTAGEKQAAHTTRSTQNCFVIDSLTTYLYLSFFIWWWAAQWCRCLLWSKDIREGWTDKYKVFRGDSVNDRLSTCTYINPLRDWQAFQGVPCL